MVLFEIRQRFKGRFLNELRVFFQDQNETMKLQNEEILIRNT